jgi:cell wall-associated NlpC family hydrolase
VITPAADAVEPAAAAATPASVPTAAEPAHTAVIPEFAPSAVARTLPLTLVELRPTRIASASRAAVRRHAKPKPRPVQKARPAGRAESASTTRPAGRSSQRTAGREAGQRGTRDRATRQRATRQRATEPRSTKQRATKRATTRRAASRAPRRTVTARRGLSAVVAYARAQVGKRYARGAVGPHRFDCSGLTLQAYRRIGLRLPHSSGGQAARARAISRSQARPGDLVVGPGHVGVYMGGGMMVDAGNPRTGVVYRRLYAGLHVERF